MKTDPICIDLSHWQANPDWAKLKAAGIRGIILKCTESTNYVDPTFKDRYQAALNNGFAVATYHFFNKGDPEAQMKWYLKHLDPASGERVVIDHEVESCSLTMLHEAVQVLLDLRQDLQITIYSGHLIKDQLAGKRDDFLAATTSLWLAQYTTATPSWPASTWANWALHQYSDKGMVAGAGPYDVNRFNGDDDAFLRWMGPVAHVESLPEPAPAPIPEAATATLLIDSDVPINLTVQLGKNVTLLP